MTESELLLLGLVAEMPRHGYELELIIEQRGMREWARIGFSSIYFVMGQLEKAGYVAAGKPAGAKARKIFSVTPAGEAALVAHTIEALGRYHPTQSSVLLGMLHWPLLPRERAIAALAARAEGVARELARLEDVRFQRQPLPDHIEVLFDFSAGQLQAEQAWIAATLDYMKRKP